MTLEAIKWGGRKLTILDQLLLPLKEEYIDVTSVEDGWVAINKMQVRGAPAIAIVGCLSLATELAHGRYSNASEVVSLVLQKLKYLVTARPTAVNMETAAKKLTSFTKNLKNEGKSAEEIVEEVIGWCEKLLEDDVTTNVKIGKLGAAAVLNHIAGGRKARLLTHCNTGSLATAGYGTALGVVRALQEAGRLEHVYCTETRPYNQGSRLTAFELVAEGLPGTLICDSAAAALMKEKGIDAVIVGADRVAGNWDTANKIGTYQLAVVAKHHGIPFFVCSPTTSIDQTLSGGADIPIEERSHKEITDVAGTRIAAPGIACWNPGFDITPADLITGGVVTETEVIVPPSATLSKA
ncbi:methylthioribose-1-phosphate isomerase-like [Portunus trituberculatus]|uniref:methylthioribose-1-phosphate isomerase-like n=1 Tax=Portunus trituberculatus TaxID=210409 RepID=UPI001E1CB03B|nr:methylthioribose-1-phosphate isomerase-like [Portunus trituberculatus]XP_045126894.1 methylthioribose-1-phosphate isomerase-like [Portunus trituberculatus]XP_045126895.1 methylthioribose-1-phosphate isomerase-like [Portunus trituberculatus]XP_045126896.1 methylthioribose-1-phosphate isomerase-like [Portunus trituberculatus]